MDHPTSYYKDLLAGFIRDELTAEQAEALLSFIRQYPDVYKEMLDDPAIQELSVRQAQASGLTLSAQADTRIKGQILAHAGQETGAGKVSLLRRWIWAAAAAVLLIGATTVLTMLRNRTHNPATTARAASDITAPQVSKARVTLAGGQVVALDSLSSGLLAQQGSTRLMKLAGGRIAYQAAKGETFHEMQYNTLTNPRGSKVVDIQLSDGSHIWLNAGSSITYPVAFVGDERKVELKGEGYFEVTKDAARQFIVAANGVNTVVLGTHFNVHAYEQQTNVTLLEGRVKVARQGQVDNGIAIRLGQQAQASGTGKLQVAGNIDLAAVMAWKNGVFNFDGMEVRQAMAELERWYDIDVTYEEGVQNVKVFGEIDRNLALGDVLEILGNAGFHYRLEAGRKLVLMK
ncbi:FecR domain-containing protein [Chitinophaga sp. YIM B06452]|uniref:FecR family protein n=1 Tax=Chitinophaga sp. YIM B06452 TaxID=3082158 RepID=UPI0031FEA68C